MENRYKKFKNALLENANEDYLNIEDMLKDIIHELVDAFKYGSLSKKVLVLVKERKRDYVMNYTDLKTGKEFSFTISYNPNLSKPAIKTLLTDKETGRYVNKSVIYPHTYRYTDTSLTKSRLKLDIASGLDYY